MTPAHWLLEVEIDGRVYRWSEQAVEVTTTDADTLVYDPGLGDLTAAQGDTIDVTVRDPAVDWSALAPYLDGRPATLLRWVEGTDYEEAEVYAIGEAVGVEWGARDEPVSFTVAPVSGSASLGHQVPDPLARVHRTTWPTTGAHEIGTEGAVYPLILGYPGDPGSADPVPVVPVPLGQWKSATTATTYAIVSEDGDAAISTVQIRNDDLDVEATQTVVVGVDLLGRLIRVAHFSLNTSAMPSAANTRLYAGYSSSGGGGVARSAYDVVEYLLRRYGTESVDWARLPEVRDALGLYMVDTWIDSTMSDPWAWIEGAILPDLPFDVRTSRRGRYLVERRYVSDPTRQVGEIDFDGGVAVRVGSVSREGAPVNELVGLFRGATTGDWLGRVILTGDSVASAPRADALPFSTSTQEVVVVRSARCLDSVSRYGLRQGTPIEVDWTWDTGTLVRCLEWRADRDAIPAVIVEARIDDGEDIREGDEYLVTDSGLGWADRPAIVDGPPVRGVTTTVRLRLPEES